MPKLKMLDENIVLSEYPLRAMVSAADILTEFKQRKQLMQGRPHFLLVKLQGITMFDDSAAGVLSGQDFVQSTRAVAIVLEQQDGYSDYGKLLLERFLWTEKLTFPVQLFQDQKKAIHWFSTL